MAELENNTKAAKKKRSFFLKKRFLIPFISLLLIATLYCLFVFSTFSDTINAWRKLYIETAMTTADHQWLATAFIPDWIIERDYTPIEGAQDIIGGIEGLETKPEEPAVSEPVPEDTRPEETQPVPEEPIEPADILGQANLTVGEPDYAGYPVVINDIEQGLVVSEIEDSGDFGTFRGKIMLIDDPSRVYLGTTPYKHVEGLRIKAMMAHHGAIAGINASGFNDPGDSGHGGDVIGLTCSQGEFWGTAVSYYGSVLITENHKLVVGNVRDWQNYTIREGIQFGPVLIADGVAQFKDSGGYGLQPRTAIGQREDGVIVFLIIDGRQPTWSLGCTVSDMIGVLQKYGVVNAACCDGGSSSVMAYNGEVITKNSSKNPTYGRRLPNAWLVRPKETEAVSTDE